LLVNESRSHAAAARFVAGELDGDGVATFHPRGLLDRLQHAECEVPVPVGSVFSTTLNLTTDRFYVGIAEPFANGRGYEAGW